MTPSRSPTRLAPPPFSTLAPQQWGKSSHHTPAAGAVSLPVQELLESRSWGDYVACRLGSQAAHRHNVLRLVTQWFPWLQHQQRPPEGLMEGDVWLCRVRRQLAVRHLDQYRVRRLPVHRGLERGGREGGCALQRGWEEGCLVHGHADPLADAEEDGGHRREAVKKVKAVRIQHPLPPAVQRNCRPPGEANAAASERGRILTEEEGGWEREQALKSSMGSHVPGCSQHESMPDGSPPTVSHTWPGIQEPKTPAKTSELAATNKMERTRAAVVTGTSRRWHDAAVREGRRPLRTRTTSRRREPAWLPCGAPRGVGGAEETQNREEREEYVHHTYARQPGVGRLPVCMHRARGGRLSQKQVQHVGDLLQKRTREKDIDEDSA
eukprot:CAMPEP_0180396122 /NCGR_PEP_ID=MMETSP0989-20121125/35270_1 /TAXON_ID=697907 /ORGANISM="non described non described, Strain CCMP2293" /LENGTH=379 /DNA_ID=CAMNT_0022398363 /DNA_START=62 /DNA_END=1200 /DNA_ORIENTATION=+